MASDPRSPIQRALQRKTALFNERSSWVDHWREISRYQAPRMGRYFVSDRNKGTKRYNDIIDNTAIFAARTLGAGLMSGMTSPARPWFRLGLKDKDLMESPRVRSWLHESAELLRAIFARSNFYNAMHAGYMELGLFGTMAAVVEPDFENVIHLHLSTAGEYMLGTDARGNVDSYCREWQMTALQMVKEFGEENCSSHVVDAARRGNGDAWFDVVHLIEPRADRDRTKLDGKNMPYASLYFEPGQNTDKFLREGGMKRFRVLAPRWEVTGNDIYGQSPGMECLGDVKQLQHQQLRKGQAIDYQVNPPLQVPSSYNEHKSSRLPGGIMVADATGPANAIRSAFDVNLNLQHLTLDIEDVRQRVRGSYYADLFLMLANDTRGQMTATEVAERHEEKMLMLGPVLERLHHELLAPAIDIAFELAAEAQILPPPPEELQDMELEVEFISTLAQAQKAVAAQTADRIVTMVGSMAAAKADPAAWDKLDTDQITDDYADMLGVPPRWVVSDEQVAEIRAQRAQAQAAMQAQAAAESATKSAAQAAQVPTQGGGSNLAADVLSMFTGYNSPAATEVM